jgi:hypothetical protein
MFFSWKRRVFHLIRSDNNRPASNPGRILEIHNMPASCRPAGQVAVDLKNSHQPATDRTCQKKHTVEKQEGQVY